VRTKENSDVLPYGEPRKGPITKVIGSMLYGIPVFSTVEDTTLFVQIVSINIVLMARVREHPRHHCRDDAGGNGRAGAEDCGGSGVIFTPPSGKDSLPRGVLERPAPSPLTGRAGSW